MVVKQNSSTCYLLFNIYCYNTTPLFCQQEMKSQALKLLGSMDFLGNPIGLMQDIQDGLKELLMEGNVSGLAKNVTHGLSNTASKVNITQVVLFSLDLKIYLNFYVI